MSIYRMTFKELHSGIAGPHVTDEDYRCGPHNGYTYVGSLAAARRAIVEYAAGRGASVAVVAEWADIEKEETPKNKREMIALLNQWGGHEDNG